MKKLLISFLLVLFMSVYIHAAHGTKEAGKTIGEDIKSAGKSAKESFKDIGKAAEKALKKAGRHITKTGKEVKKDINQERPRTASETITRNIESGYKKTRDATRKYWEKFLRAIKIRGE